MRRAPIPGAPRRAALGAAVLLPALLAGCEALRILPPPVGSFQRDPDSGTPRGPVHLITLPQAAGPLRDRAAAPGPERPPLDPLLQDALLECREPGESPRAGYGATTLLLGTLAQLGTTWITDRLASRADALRERAHATYGVEVVMTGGQLRRARCLVFQRELPGRPPGTFQADAGAGLTVVFRVKTYATTVMEQPPPTRGPKGVMVTPAPVARLDAAAIQLEPIYLRVNRAVAWTGTACGPEPDADPMPTVNTGAVGAAGAAGAAGAPAAGAAGAAGDAGAVPVPMASVRAPCIDLAFAFAMKPIVKENGRYASGEPLTAGLTLEGVRLNRTHVAVCESATAAAEQNCRTVEVIGRQNTPLIPLPPDDDVPLTLAVAASESGRVGVRLDRARAQLDALGATLGPMAKELVGTLRAR